MTIKFHILFRACDKIESVHNAKRPFGLNKLEVIKVSFYSLYTSLKDNHFRFIVIGDDLSKELIDFPGRVFSVESVVKYSKRNLKDLYISKANITTRNFPIDVKDIRKKSKILDGGDNYLFFTTNHLNEQIIIKTKKPH